MALLLCLRDLFILLQLCFAGGDRREIISQILPVSAMQAQAEMLISRLGNPGTLLINNPVASKHL